MSTLIGWFDLSRWGSRVWKIYKNRKEPNATSKATTLAASAAETIIIPSASPAKITVKNILLVPYTPRWKEWGSWQIRSPYATNTVVSHAVHKQLNQEQREEELGREEEEGELAYEPHSPYYSSVYPPEFYEDE